jgi:DNA-binding transcriptional MerR regulator/methylmalonyl-CoA mutase cobalamin-binding subunit
MVAGLGIAAVERDTGLSKDLLRVWERRYGFPQPQRDAQGERVYPADQVQRLRHIKRLLDAGSRPSHVVALPMAALLKRMEELQPPAARDASAHPASGLSAEAMDELLAPLLNHQLYVLQESLQSQLLKRGLSSYVIEVLAPLIGRVGHLWTLGQVQIYEEHLFTEVVQQQLHRAIAMLPAHERQQQPRVLLGTTPGEEHGLGLLMAHSLLALAGCQCISLGLQTPLGEMVNAARSQQVDVLAVSFSAYASPASVEAAVTHLLATLPPSVELWAGGQAAALRRMQGRHERLRVVTELGQLDESVRVWRERRRN